MASCRSNSEDDKVTVAIRQACHALSIPKLKPLQEVIREFVKGNDVFVSLPTGFGKSMCYGCLPLVFDHLRERKGSVAVVVSPLLALISDQIAKFHNLGLSSGQITGSLTRRESEEVLKGQYQLLPVTPEALELRKWRTMLQEEPYHGNLIAFVIDEAHCVKQWGDTFHKCFSRLGEARSIIPEHVNVMALTATATKNSRQHIMRVLQMNSPKIVAVVPSKENIKYSVIPFESIEQCVAPVVESLSKYGTECDKTVIFCSKREICSYIYLYMKSALGSKSTHPPGAPTVSEFHLFDCYTVAVDEHVKKHIVSSFTQSDCRLRVVIGTIAFGMGLDCPNIRNVIHIGAPETVEDYIQQTGRDGRDGKPCFAVLYHGSGLSRTINKDM